MTFYTVVNYNVTFCNIANMNVTFYYYLVTFLYKGTRKNERPSCAQEMRLPDTSRGAGPHDQTKRQRVLRFPGPDRRASTDTHHESVSRRSRQPHSVC